MSDLPTSYEYEAIGTNVSGYLPGGATIGIGAAALWFAGLIFAPSSMNPGLILALPILLIFLVANQRTTGRIHIGSDGISIRLKGNRFLPWSQIVEIRGGLWVHPLSHRKDVLNIEMEGGELIQLEVEGNLRSCVRRLKKSKEKWQQLHEKETREFRDSTVGYRMAAEQTEELQVRICLDSGQAESKRLQAFSRLSTETQEEVLGSITDSEMVEKFKR